MGSNYRRSDLRDHTSQLLRSLGEDPDEIARRLHDAGVQGDPGDARGCAVAMYLSAVMGADPGVSRVKVTTSRVTVSRGLRLCVVVRMPKAVRRFVAGFDHNQYPRLVRRHRPLRVAEEHTTVS